MRYFKIVVAALIIILAVMFVLQNEDLQKPAKIEFSPLLIFEGLGGDVQETPQGMPQETVQGTLQEAAPLVPGSASEPAAAESPPAHATAKNGVMIRVYVLIFIAFFFGILVASLFALGEKFRLKRLIKEANSRFKGQEAEIKRLRNLPLAKAIGGISQPEPEEKKDG